MLSLFFLTREQFRLELAMPLLAAFLLNACAKLDQSWEGKDLPFVPFWAEESALQRAEGQNQAMKVEDLLASGADPNDYEDW